MLNSEKKHTADRGQRSSVYFYDKEMRDKLMTELAIQNISFNEFLNTLLKPATEMLTEVNVGGRKLRHHNIKIYLEAIR